MRKIAIAVFVLFLSFSPVSALAATPVTVTANITGDNEWTTGISPRDGHLLVSIKGTAPWVATVTAQRSIDNGSSYDFVLGASWTANVQTRIEDYFPGVLYRLGCDATPGWTSHTDVGIIVLLGK